MNIHRIPTDTRVNPFGRERFFAGGREAVLIIHGFTGRTGEMVYLATELNNHGYTVSVPRLPGHGTNGADFLQSNADQWLRRATDAYFTLRTDYDRVYIVGLSMGGVLAALLGAQFQPDALALCAPALLVRKWNLWLAPLVGRIVPRWSVPYEPDSEDPVERELQLEYYSYQWVRPAGELHRLIQRARRTLPEITAPTLTVVSDADETVPTSVADLIERRTSAARTHRVHLVESDHVVVNGVDRERVAREIHTWFAATSAGERAP
ncbi:MAG: alpha/beta hydrolase [Spirochaetaceae bacterium]